jgi:nucleoid-associated protein YgaU
MTVDLSNAGRAIGPPALGASLRKVHPGPAPGERAEIVFTLNPERITVSHTYKTAGATGTSLDEQIKNLGFIEIRIDKIYLIGESTKSDADTLLKWSCPAPTAPAQTGKQENLQPVILDFSWGTGLTYTVSLRAVTINYTRFAGDSGKPIRAEVHLELYADVNASLPMTNPTSGGPPGRSSHVLDASECLASLATARYGRPGAWRQIARANGIDDPLRVRPGTLIYLPEPGEGPVPADGSLP